MSEYQNLLTEEAGGVLTVQLNRPKANAFDRVMVEELLAVLKHAASDAGIRCLVLTGAGRVFSAGQDVGIIAERLGEISFREHLERTFNRVILRMRQLEKPIVGAINGAAAGAGLGIALATDIRLAAESARFVFGFTGIGLAADSGTSLNLPLLIGMARAAEMAFTNAPVSADQALAFGLVNRVVPDPELPAAAAELAASLAGGPTRALGLTKRAFNRAVLENLERTLDYEAYLQDIAGKTEDHKEGVSAFVEKRRSRFRGV
ncbi:MAG: 2-(1,2-epoxy-1,2-dihydrophenyl)acetyl-CoA isomerase [Chloroflexi bacterium RBG_19FT_COMBO_62_14]|nr:MAG: 2-(1,2-epoxy-1,2-dihydrophenyl)acetyl-CoA isomerase [Chloroflexi bacterium RBG_19FT_COMBO_62_14]